MTLDLVRMALGLALLVGGAELLVRGAVRLAQTFGVPPLIVGLTVVAYGTSAPELSVSVLAALEGRADIALGNVVGSNTFNVLCILGLSALITPLAVERRLVRLDVPLMISASLLTFGLALDGRISRPDGALLVAGALVYTASAVWRGRRDAAPGRAGAPPAGTGGVALPVLLAAAGLGLLVLGSRLLVAAAVVIARDLGVSELVVGLTVVAAGTSLPELATSVVAALRGERDIAVGNVVGSNLFNLLAVLGSAALLAPRGVAVAPTALTLDMPVMLVAAAACLPVVWSGHAIDRLEGGVLLAGFVVYTIHSIASALRPDWLGTWSAALVVAVLPLLGLLLAVSVLPRGALRRAVGGSA